MTRRTIGQHAIALALLTLFSLPQGAAAIGTAFTYQGQLEQSGSPGTGPCDFRFMLFDTAGNGSPPTGGNQIGNLATADGVQVSNGLFTLPLDFGAAAFTTGSDRWLQIAVRCPAGSGSYQTLAPRQPLTPAPFALFASTVADGSVGSAKLASGAVMTSQLAANAVTAAQIADGTITTNDLANGAVSTAKIGDGQVTSAKLASGAVATSQLAANAVTGAQIADGTITTNDLANAAVSTAKIGDGQVTSAKLASGAVATSQLAANAVTAAQIADGTIATNDLANAAVSTAKIGDGQVTAAKLVAPLRLTSSSANTTIGAFDGTSTAANGIGVSGTGGSGDDAVGVSGFADAGAGVFGESSNGDGVRGLSQNGDGVVGEAAGSGDGVNGGSEFGAGVHGQSTSGTGVLGEGVDYGVRGFSATGEGVIGITVKLGGIGVHGIANINNGGGLAEGVFGESDAGVGVAGRSQQGVGVAGLGKFGVYGTTIATDGTGVNGITVGDNDANAVGVRGRATQGIGVRGESGSGLAGLFVGPVQVAGNLIVNGGVFAGQKFFKIDHPLDPANKYLMHAAVESSDMKNLYDGVAVLDTNGEARVDLPEWFEALNRDFRYQLTCIGGAAPVYVADEVNEAHFRIAGGTPGLKVSWQVTGIRKDPFAVTHPMVVEPEKSADERGRYLYPAALGMPASLSVDRAKQLAIQ